MKYQPLLDLRLRHSYYSDGRCPDFKLVLSESSRQVLDSRRCLVRIDSDQLRILGPVGDDQRLLIPFSPGLRLRFELVLQNPDFPYFTDLGDSDAPSARLYSPSEATAEGPILLGLAATGDSQPDPGHFAAIDLPCPVAADGETPQPASYVLPFAAKQLRWAYYCLTGTSTDASALHIIDAAPSGTSEVLSFPDGSRADLSSEPDPSDSTAVQLVAQYPTLRCVRFLSDQPISCRQQPRPYLELRLGEERLLGPLPNPSPRSVAGGVLLFRVIKYRTQPLLTQ